MGNEGDKPWSLQYSKSKGQKWEEIKVKEQKEQVNNMRSAACWSVMVKYSELKRGMPGAMGIVAKLIITIKREKTLKDGKKKKAEIAV